MDKLEAISVNLTTEEMVVLLDHLGVDGYAGLDTSKLDALAKQELFYNRSIALDETLSKIDKVSSSDINEFAHMVLSANEPALAVIGPLDKDELPNIL